MDIDMACVAAWTTDSNTASRDRMDYRSISRRFNLENEPFFTSDTFVD